MNKPMIIAGPQGSGKTKNASSFLRVFGCAQLVDEWNGRSPLKDGDLALTNLVQFKVPTGCRVMSVTDALGQIKAAQ